MSLWQSYIILHIQIQEACAGTGQEPFGKHYQHVLSIGTIDTAFAVMSSLILERLKQISAARPKIFTEQQMPSLIAITDQPRQAASHEDC